MSSQQQNNKKRNVRRRVPLGTIRPWTAQEIAALATITPEDIEYAKADATSEIQEFLSAISINTERKRAQWKRSR